MAHVGERETLGRMTDVVVREAPTELEAEAAAEYLRAEGCAATVRKRTIVAFPGVAEPPGTVAEVRVSEKDAERARSLLEAYDGASLGAEELEAQALAARMPRAEARARSDAKAVALRLGALISLLGNVYLVFILFVEPRLGGVEMLYDADGNVVVASRYEPGDVLPYEVETYDSAGRTLTLSLDGNRDGNLERITSWVFTEAGGVNRVVSYDRDEDATPEREEYYRGEAVVVTGLDRDEDGLMETLTHEPTSARLRDDDDDGFPDLYYCPETASVRQIDLRTCLPPE